MGFPQNLGCKLLVLEKRANSDYLCLKFGYIFFNTTDGENYSADMGEIEKKKKKTTCKEAIEFLL